MLKNPRDETDRPLCPICDAPMGAEPALQAGDFAYHVGCWRPRDIRPVHADPASYLDDTALTVLGKLGEPSENVRLCPPCIMAATGVDRADMMKAVRTLLLVGKIRCFVDYCTACCRRDTLVWRAPPPFLT